jgi:hypothetical protein
MRDNRAAPSYPPMCQLASGIPLRPLQLYRARRPVEARDGQHIALFLFGAISRSVWGSKKPPHTEHSDKIWPCSVCSVLDRTTYVLDIALFKILCSVCSVLFGKPPNSIFWTEHQLENFAVKSLIISQFLLFGSILSVNRTNRTRSQTRLALQFTPLNLEVFLPVQSGNNCPKSYRQAFACRTRPACR